MIQEKRGMLKMWNIYLILGTFLLSIFATFLTRSGLIESVHSFAENTTIAYIFLGFLTTVTLVCAALVWWRRGKLQPESQVESWISRETAFLANNLLFVGVMFAVLWGTTFPLISEGIFKQKIQVGPPFYNRVNIPLGLILLFLMGVGPVIAWRKATVRNLRRNFTLPALVALGVGAVLYARGIHHPQALLTFILGSFTLTTVAVEFRKGTKARAAIEKEGSAKAFVHLVSRNRRRYGGYIVHVGLVVAFMGLAGKAYNVEKQVTLRPGESMEILSPFGHTFHLRYETMSWYTATNMTKLVASVHVEEDGRSVGLMTAEQRAYKQREETNTEVGIRREWNEDLYLILAGIDDPNGVVQGTNPKPLTTFRVLINPLVSWIWLGGLVMAIGTLIALWPSSLPAPKEPRLRAPGPSPLREEEEELVEV
jgi:cytochrome c-type biogenesis protein CcmF